MQLVVFKINPIGVPFLWTDKALTQDWCNCRQTSFKKKKKLKN